MNFQLFNCHYREENQIAVIKTGLDSTRRYTFAELNGFLFIANGVNRPQVYDGKITRNMGIEMDGTAPTFVNNTVAGGALAASGKYRYIYQYYNSNRFQPSGFSSSSAELTANASGTHGIRIAIPANAGLEAGVDFAKVFRTLDSGGLYRYDGIIAYTGSAVNYDSKLADASLGEVLGEANINGTSNDDVDDLPPTAPFILSHKGRIAMFGRVMYSLGTAAVTNGNATVTLTGANLTAGMDTWQFLVAGDSKSYTIGTIDVTAQTFKLNDALGTEKTYDGTTNATATYYIYNTGSVFFYSYIDLNGNSRPESFQALGYIPIQPEDGDDASGIGRLAEFWFLGKRNNCYILAGDNPNNFIQRKIPASVGPCSHWSIANDLDGNIIFTHESGIYLTDGTTTIELSKDIRNMFTGKGSAPWFVNQDHITKAHSVYDPINNILRAWVPSQDYWGEGSDSTICDKCLIYDFNKVIVEGKEITVGWTWDDIEAECSAIVKDVNGNPVVYFGDAYGFVKYFSLTATNDGVGLGADTRRGTCTSGDTTSVIDSGATFYTTGSGLQGCFAHAIAGTNAGEIRRITTNTATDITVTPAFSAACDTTTVYAIGGIDSYRKTKIYDFESLQQKSIDKARLVFDVSTSTYSAYFKLFQDFSSTEFVTEYINMDDTKGFHEIRFAANRSIHHQYKFGLHDVDRSETFREVEVDVSLIGLPQARIKKGA